MKSVSIICVTLAFGYAATAFATIPAHVQAWYSSTFAQDCDMDLLNGNTGLHEKVLGGEVGTQLFRFTCATAAYNMTSVFVREQAEGTIDALSFAEFDVGPSYKVTGVSITKFLVNADYEPKSKTITTHAKGRGVGDAFTEATYRLEGAALEPILLKYVVDQTYDGKINPVTVFSSLK